MTKILLIGCGYWGKNLIRNFYELGVLHSICDLDTEAANFIANKYNVENLSLKTVINNDDIQGVVLAVPAPMHAKAPDKTHIEFGVLFFLVIRK